MAVTSLLKELEFMGPNLAFPAGRQGAEAGFWHSPECPRSNNFKFIGNIPWRAVWEFATRLFVSFVSVHQKMSPSWFLKAHPFHAHKQVNAFSVSSDSRRQWGQELGSCDHIYLSKLPSWNFRAQWQLELLAWNMPTRPRSKTAPSDFLDWVTWSNSGAYSSRVSPCPLTPTSTAVTLRIILGATICSLHFWSLPESPFVVAEL